MLDKVQSGTRVSQGTKRYTCWSRYKAVHVLVKVQSGTRIGQGTKRYMCWLRYKAVHVLVKIKRGTRVGQGIKRYTCWSRYKRYTCWSRYKADIIISSTCNLLTLRWTTLTTSLLYTMISFLIYIWNNWKNHYNYSFNIFAINGVLQCFTSK